MRAFVALVAVVAFAASCSSGSESGRAREAPAPWQPDRSCVAHEDCRPAPSCCPAPCTSDVINVEDVDRAYQELKKTCPTTPPDCPQAGSCPGHQYMCIDQRCKLVMEGDPEYPVPP